MSQSEFAGVLSELHVATVGQRMLRQQVESLQQERDVLLDELEKAGAVSKQQLRSVATHLLCVRVCGKF